MQEIVLRYFEKRLSKTFKKVNFIFSNPVHFNGQSCKKQKGLGTSNQLLFRLWNKVHKNFFISYILSVLVWWCNIKWLLSYSKNYSCKVMQASSWHHKLFHFHLFFWVWKVWKGRGKIRKIWVSWEQKELFRRNKKHFSEFLKGYHFVKK